MGSIFEVKIVEFIGKYNKLIIRFKSLIKFKLGLNITIPKVHAVQVLTRF